MQTGIQIKNEIWFIKEKKKQKYGPLKKKS